MQCHSVEHCTVIEIFCICIIQHSSQQPHVATEYLKHDWGKESVILTNSS